MKQLSSQRVPYVGLALVLAACLVGCGGGGGGGGGSTTPVPATSGTGAANATSPVVKQVSLAPTNATAQVGQSLVLTALGNDATGNPVPVNAANWLWTTSDKNVAAITSNGDHATITIEKVGTVTISAKEGSSGATASTTVTAVAAGSAAGGGGGTPGATVVYSNDFSNGAVAGPNGAGPEWTNRTISATPAQSIYPSRNFLGEFANQTVSLSLTNLPTHGNVIVEFDLFIIRSMDGNYTLEGRGPDVWTLGVEGGPTLLNTTFSNITPFLSQAGFPTGFFQAYPGTYPGASFPFQTGAKLVNTLGYTFAGTNDDSVYHIKETVAHTAGNIQLNFTSGQTQAIADESWGLKNVVISVSP
jgi:hypothetical protein